MAPLELVRATATGAEALDAVVRRELLVRGARLLDDLDLQELGGRRMLARARVALVRRHGAVAALPFQDLAASVARMFSFSCHDS